MITIPDRNTKKVVQPNRGSVLGNVWSTFNIDLHSNLGSIRVSPRLQVNTAGVTNQGLSVAFKYFDERVFSIAGTRVFKNTTGTAGTAFVEDASTGALTDYSSDYSDLDLFNNQLFAASATKLVSKVGNGAGTGAWTERYTFEFASTNHKLCYFIKNNREYFLDGGRIKSLDTSYTVATSGDYYLEVPFRWGTPYTMLADASDIWVGTRSSTNSGSDRTGGVYILRWDGISSTVTTAYPIKAKAVIGMAFDDRGVLHAMDSNGAILAFTGSGFEEIGRLPLTREYLKNAVTVKYDSFLHPNGFTFSKNGTFLALINNIMDDSTGTIKENLPSGIWEFDSDTGFVHRQAVTYNPMATSTITDYGQNRVSRVGALVESDLPDTGANGKSTLLAGVTYYTDASSTTSGIFIDDPLNTVQKYGYIVSQFDHASGLKDTWMKIATKFREFVGATDSIVHKYRTKEETPIYIDLTWNDTTSFHTATDMDDYVGYEVEILQGIGSGRTFHISSVSSSSPWRVNLDGTVTSASGTAKARVQNWKKVTTIDSQGIESAINALGVTAERIQLKCGMLFTGDTELFELGSINKKHSIK